jgi:hypothetical protein
MLIERGEPRVSSRMGGSNGDGRGYQAPFGKKGFYFISGEPSGSGLPPVPAADALKNR